MINATFHFHPVGQGLFYSGDVGGFNFVYDCGTESKMCFLSREIQNYKRPVPRLDMLVISHFHDDHISGLKELTDRLHPRRILIPYISVDEMLLCFIRAKDNPDAVSALKYFAGYLYGDGAANGDLGLDSKVTVVKHSEQKRDLSASSVDALPSTIADNTVVQIRGAEYEFKFFNSDAFIPDVIAKFYAAMEARFKEGWRTKLVELVDSNLDEIAEIYRKTFSRRKLNLTTLVCCHGPKKGAVGLSLRRGGSHHIRRAASSSFMARQLLTGDISFQNSLVAMQNHYEREWKEIFLSLLPHHGSRDGWDPGALYSLDNCAYWPCTFGIGNAYHHPHFEAVAPFLEGRKYLMPCTQDPASRISISMTIQ